MDQRESEMSAGHVVFIIFLLRGWLVKKAISIVLLWTHRKLASLLHIYMHGNTYSHASIS
jgi:hypothetical protein